MTSGNDKNTKKGPWDGAVVKSKDDVDNFKNFAQSIEKLESGKLPEDVESQRYGDGDGDEEVGSDEVVGDGRERSHDNKECRGGICQCCKNGWKEGMTRLEKFWELNLEKRGELFLTRPACNCHQAIQAVPNIGAMNLCYNCISQWFLVHFLGNLVVGLAKSVLHILLPKPPDKPWKKFLIETVTDTIFSAPCWIVIGLGICFTPKDDFSRYVSYAIALVLCQYLIQRQKMVEGEGIKDKDRCHK